MCFQLSITLLSVLNRLVLHVTMRSVSLCDSIMQVTSCRPWCGGALGSDSFLITHWWCELR